MSPSSRCGPTPSHWSHSNSSPPGVSAHPHSRTNEHIYLPTTCSEAVPSQPMPHGEGGEEEGGALLTHITVLLLHVTRAHGAVHGSLPFHHCNTSGRALVAL